MKRSEIGIDMSKKSPNHMLEKAIAEWLCCSPNELRKMASSAGTSFLSDFAGERQYFDFLERTQKIREVAVVVFEGDEPASASWILSQQIGLSGECPICLMFDDEGYKAVETLLDQIDRGIYP